MNIKDMFLELTNRTYPHGTEKDLFPLLNSELKTDEFGNLFIKIGESDVMFTAHLDTATSALCKVNHVIDGKLIKTDGKSILGADDKAGVVIMHYMIENKIPGLYYFFLGEEVGCVGSRKLANKYKEEKIKGINKVISFDRRGYNSIITFQSGSRCCSDNFGKELSKQLNTINNSFSYKNDPTGLLTDSIQFVNLYPECTNISVGYQSEHTFSEQQDIEHLEKLAEACLKVDWNNLPVERDPSKVEYSYGNYYGYGYDDYDYGYRNKTSSFDDFPKKEITEKVWFIDDKFDHISYVEIDRHNKVVSVDLCQSRIDYEKNLIDKLLIDMELEMKSTTWDGFNLTVQYLYDHTTKCNRNDLMEYIPELDYSKYASMTDDGINEYITKNSSRSIEYSDWDYNEWNDFLDSDLYD